LAYTYAPSDRVTVSVLRSRSRKELHNFSGVGSGTDMAAMRYGSGPNIFSKCKKFSSQEKKYSKFLMLTSVLFESILYTIHNMVGAGVALKHFYPKQEPHRCKISAYKSVLRVVMSTINQPSAFVRFRLFYLAEFTLKPCLLD
jgi:hypothetical protein